MLLSKPTKYLFTALLSCLLSLSPATQAQQKSWWFDVEIILFKQNIQPNELVEEFDTQIKPNNKPQWLDLFKSYISTDVSGLRGGLVTCESHAIPAWVEESSPMLIVPELEQTLTLDLSEPLTHAMPPISPQLEALMSWYAPTRLDCEFAAERKISFAPLDLSPPPLSMPRKTDAVDRIYSQSAHLLPADQFVLDDLFRDMRWQKNLTRLLHTGWRQQVLFGKHKANAFRLYAGKNYARQFDAQGKLLPDSLPQNLLQPAILSDTQHTAQLTAFEQQQANQALFAKLYAALQDQTPIVFSPEMVAQADHVQLPQQYEEVSELWELEGYFKLYLRYIGNVPYLHVDSALDFRAPLTLPPEQPVDLSREGDNQQNTQVVLQQYPFRQVRRIVSKQLHYFDHPLFGMLVHVRRYNMPDPDSLGENSPNQGAE